MSIIYAIIKYFGVGICLGVGILLVDALYFKFGNPPQIAIMEELLDDLYESHADFIDLDGLSSFPSLSINVFGKNIEFEERCTIYFRELPGFRCDDDPHSTAADLSLRGNLDERVKMIRSIAVDGSFTDEKMDGWRVLKWFTDDKNLSEEISVQRTEAPHEPKGALLPMPELPPSFTAIVCRESMCFRLTSLSRTKVEGLLAQVLEE